MKDYQSSIWTNGSFSISWIDADMVKIEGPHSQVAVMCGGDFDNMLSALCAAYNEGRSN